MKRIHFTKQFNWRMLLVRILVNALALLVITVLPDIHFVEPTVLRVLFVAVMLGVLNAFVKPIVQFLTLRFIFITYGFAVVIINAIILLLLNLVVSNMFAVDSLIWALSRRGFDGAHDGFSGEVYLAYKYRFCQRDLAPSPRCLPIHPRPFQTMIVGEVVGPDEELAVEVICGRMTIRHKMMRRMMMWPKTDQDGGR